MTGFPGSIIRTREVPPIAWKNGAGVTREIAAHRTPAASDIEWRISVADLACDASFSRFPGLDRTFVVASRAGVVLEVDGVATSLEQGDSRVFPGEAAAKVSLPSGPATALNLMTAGGWSGSVRVMHVRDELVVPYRPVAVLILEGSAVSSRGALEPMDFLLCGAGVETLHSTTTTTTLAVLIEVHRG